MNSNPAEALNLVVPVFQFLDRLIQEQGIYLYMVCVWLSPLLIIWILKGGFWRRPARPTHVVFVTKSEPPPVPPKLSPTVTTTSHSPTDNDGQSFTA